MLDWQVHEEEQPLASDDRAYFPVRRVRNWWRFGGLLLLLILVGLFVFRWRVKERTDAMQEDLKVFVRYEEQQRLFGLREQADKLMVPDAPNGWREGYRSTFVQADEVKPVEVVVEAIELDGTNAYVTVRLDGLPQMRAYQLVEQKWRRAPLSDTSWGQARQLYLARLGVTIFYRAHDEQVVQKLATDLPLLLPQWPLKTEIRRIRVHPQEFGEALLEVKEDEMTLNSPSLLIPKQVNAETTIRLALADTLLVETSLEREVGLPPISGAASFLQAIRTTFILRWAMPDEAIPRQIWHESGKNENVSPFLSNLQTNQEDLLPSQAWKPSSWGATMLLMADSLYDQYGNEGLQQVINKLPTTPSWDRIFYPLTGYYTVELEEQLVSNKIINHSRPSNALQLPLDATLLDMDLDNGILNFEVKELVAQNDAQIAHLAIKMDESLLNGLQQTVSPGRCAALHKKLTITEGDWLEVGQTLQARNLVVSRSSSSLSLPKDRTLALSDTFVYLAEQSTTPKGDWKPYRIIALSEAGTTTNLTTLPALMSLGWRIPAKGSRRARFLLTLSLPECEEAWLFMYDPRRGILSRWFASFSDSSILRDVVWNPLEGEMLLTRSTAYEHDTRFSTEVSLPSKEQSPLQTDLSHARYPLIWHSNQAVILNRNRGTVKLIDIALGKVAQIMPLSSEKAHFFMLSEDEKHLFYAHGLPPAKKQSVHLLDFESGKDSLLFSLPASEWLQPVVGGTSTTYMLLLKAAERTTGPIATQLLRIGLSAGEPTVIMDLLPNEIVTSALVCEEDSVMVTIERAGENDVRLWQPNREIKSLFKTKNRLQLLGCY